MSIVPPSAFFLMEARTLRAKRIPRRDSTDFARPKTFSRIAGCISGLSNAADASYHNRRQYFWTLLAGTSLLQTAMKVLILGGKGRLGGALARIWSANHDLRAISRPELDVANLHGLEDLLESASYDVLVNCTGLTRPAPLRDRAGRSTDRKRLRSGRHGGGSCSEGSAFYPFQHGLCF